MDVFIPLLLVQSYRLLCCFFFSSRRRHTRSDRDWSSDVCSSDLSAVMMATDFLLNAHKPTDPSFHDIMQIKQNANRAASLVRQLLAFSRRQTLRPQVLDLGEALSDLSMLLRRLIGEKVTLEVVHGRDLWPMRADLSQFEQVIVNLAVNARDAMPNGGKLEVRTRNLTAAECAGLTYNPITPG